MNPYIITFFSCCSYLACHFNIFISAGPLIQSASVMERETAGRFDIQVRFWYPKNSQSELSSYLFLLSEMDQLRRFCLVTHLRHQSVGGKAAVFLYAEIKPNRVSLLRRFLQGVIKRLAFILLKWRFLRVRRIYRWTEAPLAARQFPLKTTLTSTSKSWKTSQRNTEKKKRQGRCLCTHLGRFGWTGNICSVFLVVLDFIVSGRAGMMEEKYSRPQLSAGLPGQI